MQVTRDHRIRLLALLASTLLLAGCGKSQPTLQSGPAGPASAPIQQRAHPKPPERLTAEPGLHNLVRISERMISGSEPHGDVGFASLAKLGVRTVVSVDGARPNLQAARKHGIRYVHIPIGYDGINETAGKALARAACESKGPIYFHCHHGQHRGPAAAAIACMAYDQRSGTEALAILAAAGTGKQYAGLFRDVEKFVPPAKGEPLPDLKEVAEVESFAAAMAKIDRNFDNLKLCLDAGWRTPDGHPDIEPKQEALILEEGLRESARNLTADRNDQFKAWLSESEATALRFREAVMRGDAAIATAEFAKLEASCKQCHTKYRN